MFNNKKLIYVFVALLVIVVLVLTVGTKKESTFKQDLVNIDTSNVSKIILYPKSQQHKEVKLFKQKDGWFVETAKNKTKPVPESKVKALVNQLSMIKPIRLAARSESKWKEYQVDSTGTRVEAYENGVEKS